MSSTALNFTGRHKSGHHGGTATLKKHGIEHMKEIGRMGGRPKAKILRKEDVFQPGIKANGTQIHEIAGAGDFNNPRLG